MEYRFNLIPLFIELALGVLLLTMPNYKKRCTVLMLGVYYLLKGFLSLSILNSVPNMMVELEYFHAFTWMTADTFLYLAIFSLVFPMRAVLRRYGYIFILGIVIGAIYAFVFSTYSVEDQQRIVMLQWHSSESKEFLNIYFARLLLDGSASLQVIYFQIVILHFGWRFHKFVHDRFSYEERVRLGSIVALEVVLCMSYIIDTIVIMDYSESIRIAYIIMEVTLASVVYFLVANNKLFDPKRLASQFVNFVETGNHLYFGMFFTQNEVECESSKQPPLMAREKCIELYEALVDYFIAKKPYLSQSLDLDQVAAAIGTNRRYISVILNAELGVSFYEFVNIFRADEVLSVLRDSPELKMKNTAFNCGFCSYTTFVKYHKILNSGVPQWYADIKRRSGVNSDNNSFAK